MAVPTRPVSTQTPREQSVCSFVEQGRWQRTLNALKRPCTRVNAVTWCLALRFCLSRKVALIVFASSSMSQHYFAPFFSEQLALPNVFRTIAILPFYSPSVSRFPPVISSSYEPPIHTKTSSFRLQLFNHHTHTSSIPYYVELRFHCSCSCSAPGHGRPRLARQSSRMFDCVLIHRSSLQRRDHTTSVSVTLTCTPSCRRATAVAPSSSPTPHVLASTRATFSPSLTTTTP